MYNKDNVILLVNKVKNKAVTRNQLATADRYLYGICL